MRRFKLRYCLTIIVFHVFIVSALCVTASFTYTKRSNCAPTVVVFTNNSTQGTGITYIWNFGLGTVVSTSDISSKEQVYTSAGEYNVTLVVTDGTNSDTARAIINISQGPSANFTATPLYGCSPLMVEYTSTSTSGDTSIASYNWDFRNGNYGKGNPIQYTYTTAGKYNVVLTVTDKNGCSSLIEFDSLINVVKKPIANFRASDTFACNPPLNVSYTNLSTGATDLTYKWDYGNGETSTEISNSSEYDSTGSYNVKLVVTDQYGCTDSLVKKSYIKIGTDTGTISVYNANNALVNSSSLCKGNYKFIFSLANLPDYTWIITDNNETSTISGNDTLSYFVTGSGELTIKLIYGKLSYCTNSITKTFTKKYIKANFTISDTLFCSVPQKVNLDNTSKNADNYSWYFSDQLFSNSTDTSFTITKNDLPSETYQQLYNHEVNSIYLPFTLIATNDEGCTDSITKQVTLSLPVARFMPDKISGCIPLLVSFSDSSKSDFLINKYVYKIGNDSITSTTKTVSYTFTEPGEYYVTEIITSGSCYDTSYAVKVVAGEKLVPDFTITPTEVCNEGTIHLTGTSNNNAVVDSWQFTSANIFNLNFSSIPDTSIVVYSDSLGYKDVTLQIDYNGCLSDTTKNNIFKINGLKGYFTQSFSCDSPLLYLFKSEISPVTSLAWTITVDTSVYNYSTDSVQFKFPQRGNYPVELVAGDSILGCYLTRIDTIKVRQVAAAFTLNDSIFCVGDTVSVDASSSIDYINTCYNEGFLWDWGNDSPPNRTFSTTYDHIYDQKGTDTIVLIVTADNGCMDTTTSVVHILKPEGKYTVDKDTGCLSSLNVTFTNTSTDTTIVSWIWSFGDGASDNTDTISISHIYSSSVENTYTSSLTVYDAYQCYSSTSLPITLIGINSDFQADDNAICTGNSVTFTPVDSTLESLYWNFGDGNTSDSTSVHTYSNNGLFSVSLIASKSGCRDTVTKQNYISVEKAVAYFTVSDSILNCYPDTLSFVHDNLNGSTANTLVWTFDSQILNTNADSVTYIYYLPGNYSVQLSVQTLNNCQASSSKSIVITGPTASYSFSPKQICYGGTVTFQLDSVDNLTTWKWIFGDGNTSTDNPAVHSYSSRGEFVPSILLINQNCTVTNTLDTLSVSKVKANFYTVEDSSHICLDNEVDFINSSSYSVYYDWNINNIHKSDDTDLSNVLFATVGDYSVTLIATGADNCADTLTKKYTVVPLPEFSILGDSIMCKGQDSIILTVNKDSADWQISWTPTTGLSNSNTFTTVARPTSSTTYTAQVTDAYGCTASREKTILINQAFNLSRTPVGDTSIYIGETIQLLVSADTNNVSYSWSPNYNISCLSCNNPYVSPTEDVTYQVEVKNSCFDFIEDFNINVIIDFYLEAPSAFTPNGDSNNDNFKLEIKDIKSFDLKIFNRWGEIVFSTNDVNTGWDGYVNGHAQNIDTYIYYVKAESIHGYKFEKKGNFLLLK